VRSCAKARSIVISETSTIHYIAKSWCCGTILSVRLIFTISWPSSLIARNKRRIYTKVRTFYFLTPKNYIQ
jgi:hypothetical protein